VKVEKIIPILKLLVESLVEGEYSLIQLTGRSGPYTSEQLKELVEEYGGKLTIPPDEDYKNINIIEVEDEPEYFIEYELWVDGEKSDLTLSCTVQFTENEVTIMIENIHVL
jgi:hypothetical protein